MCSNETVNRQEDRHVQLQQEYRTQQRFCSVEKQSLDCKLRSQAQLTLSLRLTPPHANFDVT